MSDSVRPAFVVLHTEARDPTRKANNNLAKMEKALCLESAMRDGCCPALQALQAAIGRGRANRLASMRAELI